MSRLDRISAQEYDIQKRIWLQGINSRHSMRGTAGRSTRDRMGFSERSRLSDRIEYLTRRRAVLDGQPIPPMRQSYELSQIDPFVVPTREAPPVTLPNQAATSQSRPRRSSHQTTSPIEQPILNPRGIDRGLDIIPPFVNNVDETPSIPPIVYLESIQDTNRRIEEERLWDARAVQSQRTRDELNSIINFWSSFGRFVTGDENSMRQYDDIYNWGNESGNVTQGSIIGIGVGASRFVRGIVTSFAQLYDLIRNLPWETLRLSNSDDYIQTFELLQSIAESEIEDPAISREILNGIGEFFNNIGNRFVRAIEYAENGNNVESSAQIIEGTLEIIDLIDMVEGAFSIARHSPQTIRRLTNLRAARMKMTEAIVFVRMVREEGLLGKHVDNLDDFRMSVSPFGGGINIPITRRSHRRQLPNESESRIPDTDRRRTRDRDLSPNSRSSKALENARTNILTRTSTRSFMRDAERIIRDTPNHPLRFLLQDGRLRGGHGMTHFELGLDDRLVQAGHRDSSFMLESLRGDRQGRIDRLAIQHAFENQIQGRFEESLFIGSADSPAVVIEGVPVFESTASIWVEQGRIPLRVLTNAIPLPSIY